MDKLFFFSFWGIVSLIAMLLCAIAWRDGRTKLISLGENIALVYLGVLWHLLSDSQLTSLLLGLLAGVAGFSIVAGKIIVQTYKNQPLSLYHGDAILFASTGFLLGPLGLAYAFIINAPFYIFHHLWIAKRAKRSIWKGYAPVAPAYCIAVGIVFGFEIYQGGML